MKLTPTPEDKPTKRPASHRWAIGFLGFITAGFVILVIDLIGGRSGARAEQYWFPLAFLSCVALAFVSLLLAGRQRWTYYLTAGVLGFWSARSIYNLSVHLYYLIYAGGSTTPYFHLAERHKPFVVQRDMSLGRQILTAIVVALITWLFIRFAFGRPSRTYYGLVTTKTDDAP